MRPKIITAVTIFVTMLLLPVLIVRFAPADLGMGLCIILFFAGIPVVNLVLGVLAGKDMKQLWWIPLVTAVSFPVLFSIAVWGPVFELFIYSPFYLCIGAGAMLITHLGKRNKEKNS